MSAGADCGGEKWEIWLLWVQEEGWRVIVVEEVVENLEIEGRFEHLVGERCRGVGRWMDVSRAGKRGIC